MNTASKAYPFPLCDFVGSMLFFRGVIVNSLHEWHEWRICLSLLKMAYKYICCLIFKLRTHIAHFQYLTEDMAFRKNRLGHPYVSFHLGHSSRHDYYT